jgi:hypothetical protein
MLEGAIVGLYVQREKPLIKSSLIELLKLISCIIGFYLCLYLKSLCSIGWIQCFSLIPLLGVPYYSYRLCNSNMIQELLKNSKAICILVRLIGGLCLEIYIVQFKFFTVSLNYLFPFNIILIFLWIVFVAYMVRCIARIWSQTFKDKDYDWSSIISI